MPMMVAVSIMMYVVYVEVTVNPVKVVMMMNLIVAMDLVSMDHGNVMV